MLWARMLHTITTRYSLNTPRASILRRLPAIPPNFGEFRGKRGIRYRGYWATEDEVCRSLFWFGDFDPWVNLTLSRLARRGSVAIDIGANIGATAMPLAQAVGPDGRVICFEPMPSNIEYLRQNIAANSFAQVQVEPLALSDTVGELQMTLPTDHAGTSSVTTEAGNEQTFCVRSITFDQWLETQPKLDISVCKIDVEGHEPEVLAGMSKALSNQTIPAFVFERHVGPEVRSDPVFDLFTGYGYRLMRIDKGLSRIRYIPVGNPTQSRPTCDFVAVVPGATALEGLAS